MRSKTNTKGRETDGYCDEDAPKGSFVRDVLIPVSLVLALIVAVFAIPGCWAPAHAAEVDSVLWPDSVPTQAVAALNAPAQAVQAFIEAVAAPATPDPYAPAQMVAEAAAQAGYAGPCVFERMSAAGAHWARLEARLAREGPSEKLKAAFVAFFRRIQRGAAQ